MFEKYGNFNSAEEINKKAKELIESGDTQSIYTLAEENGLVKEDAEDYIDGCVEELCSIPMAAIGKLKVEKAAVKTEGIIEDWISHIETLCTDEWPVAVAVRRSDKNLKGCIAELLKWSWKHCYAIDSEVAKLAGVSGNVKLGIPSMRTAFQIIRSYYLGE